MAPPSLAHILPEASQPTQSSRRLLTPTTNPIPLLPSPTSRYGSYTFTLLIPLYYYFRSTALINAPLETLIQDLAPIAIAQAVFCVTCLPSAGTWNSGTKDAGKIIEGTAGVSKGGKGSMRKKGGKVPSTGSSDGLWGNKIMVCASSFAVADFVLTIYSLRSFH